MTKVLLAFKQNAINAFLLLILFVPVMFLLNLGFSLDPYWKIIQSVIFSITAVTIIVWPRARPAILIISLFLIILMACLYIVNLIEWADMGGSTGIGLIMISFITYLPELVKLGYIRKL